MHQPPAFDKNVRFFKLGYGDMEFYYTADGMLSDNPEDVKITPPAWQTAHKEQRDAIIFPSYLDKQVRKIIYATWEELKDARIAKRRELLGR
ncbi:hypothetical protein [Armatimonas rosea]|uniref:Uncharacterized protein n=1 Tax=Armatimonas rosea TaxID=685828 RepID=A0A7W9WAZ6_ARMRO|nr:hypothetical protein [Armatimonas rosea]MBB6054122.1 hypothetical protein [Armatimonas rosea]